MRVFTLVWLDSLSHLVYNDGNIVVSHLLLPQHVGVVEGDELDVVEPDWTLSLRANQNVETAVVKVTDQHGVLREVGGDTEVLAVFPDGHVLQFLEINVLCLLPRVQGGVAEVSVGQTQPGQLPVSSEAQLDVGPAQPAGLRHGEF